MRLTRLLQSTASLKSSTRSSIVSTSTLKLDPGSTVFSAIQPTGVFHLGNYLGAVRSWADISDVAPTDAKLFFAVADLHALTIPKDPVKLREWRQQALASIIASGIDPERCIVYHQSSVAEHSQLYWILSTITGMGYLNRMVQWKSKADVSELASISDMNEESLRNLQLGLFAYPALQAADILIHKANYVPVGEDQSQHLELTRYITSTFNHRFGDKKNPIFPTPSTLFAPFKKIASLRDTTKKMSKSDPDQNSCVYITDEPKVIQKKIRRAVTDSIQGPITFDPIERPGVSNLLVVASGLLRTEPQTLLETQLSHIKDHKQFKDAVSDILVESLATVRDNYKRLLDDPSYIEQVSRNGTLRARESASKTLDQVNRAVGL
ncbi:tryptophan--tRNA ligase MSW1 [Sugiyamaella lignohabitans]|uniref:Tryptophan--tRNA ligase, mitochondrial n=1 Tax=Sugiyamaella lignohabitans TaxID=796027 RepID=A0A167DEB1_9ASCO|nr:tryptophan--tRNA ligase MSW1 [Sugiyamaella lignohabitans]ANB12819.1 tryptophan--tRNA ligase MSW1 [Sugiyamaella lignohabitans]